MTIKKEGIERCPPVMALSFYQDSPTCDLTVTVVDVYVKS